MCLARQCITTGPSPLFYNHRLAERQCEVCTALCSTENSQRHGLYLRLLAVSFESLINGLVNNIHEKLIYGTKQCGHYYASIWTELQGYLRESENCMSNM